MSTVIMAWIPDLGPEAAAAAPLPGGLADEAVASVATHPAAAIATGGAAAGTGVILPHGPADGPRPAVAMPRDDGTDQCGGTLEIASGGPPPSATLRPTPRGPHAGVKFPSGSIVLLAVASAAVWGMAWRNEQLRLEVQRRGPERLARQPVDGAAATGIIRP